MQRLSPLVGMLCRCATFLVAQDTKVQPTGGSLMLAPTNGGELRLDEPLPGTDYSSFTAGPQKGNINYTLPIGFGMAWATHGAFANVGLDANELVSINCSGIIQIQTVM